VKYTFRKIVSGITSAALMGSTVALAAAASAPAPFVNGGSADVAVVYGPTSTIASTDLLAVADVQNYLSDELAAQTASSGSSGSASTSVSGGDFVVLSKSSNNVNLGDTVSTVFGTTVNDEDLPTILSDGIYTADDNDEFDYEQKLTLGSMTVSHFRDSDYEDEVGLSERTPTLGIKLSSDTHVLNYTLDFLDDAESDVVSGDMDDFEGSDIPLLGRTYYVSDAKNGSSSAANYGKFTLLDSAATGVVKEGETTTVSAGGETYEVSIDFVDADSAVLVVNGQESDDLAEGATEKLDDGSYLGIRDVRKLAVAGEIGSVEFSIGSGKLEITHGSDVKLNENTVEGLKGYIYKSSDKLDKIELMWTTDDEEFVTADSELVMPGFENIKFSMGDLVRSAEEVVTIEKDGDTSIELTAPLKDGSTSINLLYGNGTAFTGLGKATDERLATSSGNTITFKNKFAGSDYHEYMVVSYADSDDSESYVLSFKTNNDTDANRVEATIKNEITGDTWADRIAGDFTIGDVSITLGSLVKNSTDEWVTLTAGTGVNFSTMYTDGGLKIYLPVENTNADSTPNRGEINFATDGTGGNYSAGNNFDSYAIIMDAEDKDDDVAAGTEFNLTVDQTTSDGNSNYYVSLINGAGTGGSSGLKMGDDSNDYEAYISGDVAPRIVHYTDGNDDYAEVYYPSGESETYFEVVLTSGEATVSSTTTSNTSGSVKKLGNVLYSDSESAAYAGKNLVVVGGSCVNAVAAELLGGALCGAEFTAATGVGAGQYLIESFDREGKVATLVAGYNAQDTVNAAKAFVAGDIDTSAGMKYTGSTVSDVKAVVESA
jgi:hypothetical protein